MNRFVRYSRIPTLVAASTLAFVLGGCSDETPGPVEPRASLDSHQGLPLVDGSGLSVYGVGKLRRRAPAPCPEPGHSDFDFWVGKWNVKNADTGAPFGTSIISSELGGCVVMEDIIATSGFRSRSLSAYDVDTDTWYQSFVTGNTTNIRLSGGLEGASMVMTASQLAFDVRDGTIKLREHRVTWTPKPGGTVDQLVEPSFAGEPRPPGHLLYEPAATLDRADELPLPLCQASVLPGFREFDFWLGSWNVSATAGPGLGVSDVVTELSGCLIVEDFVTPTGLQSRSYVFYDFVTDTWHRTYVDENGELVQLSGRLTRASDGSPRVVMTGTDFTPEGSEYLVRITSYPLGPDGSEPTNVRHVWDVSHDSGHSWRTALSLDYERRP